MKINSKEALELLNKYTKLEDSNDIYRINHSKCVGNCAEILAKELNLNADYAKTLGYIHDIGKIVDKNKEHTIFGYEFLKSIGLDENYANICLTHSYLNNDYTCTAGGIAENIEFRTNFIKNHNYTIYEKIINICDLMCSDKVLTIEKRILEIILDRGIHENTLYHLKETFKLKDYFDELLGFNLYELFDDIVDNL